jgi:formylglycine-generating enzyme required for sulfatase activity
VYASDEDEVAQPAAPALGSVAPQDEEEEDAFASATSGEMAAGSAWDVESETPSGAGRAAPPRNGPRAPRAVATRLIEWLILVVRVVFAALFGLVAVLCGFVLLIVLIAYLVPKQQIRNALGMTLVRIEPGSFTMGTNDAQFGSLLEPFPGTGRGLFGDEQPAHRVTITRPFYLGAHEVTVGQFRRFVEATGYKTDAEQAGSGDNWRNPGFADFKQGDDYPVLYVSHNDAVKFCEWLNGQETGTGWTYRLPTEAEWEYACRAGTEGLYGGSDDPKSLVRVANVADVSCKKQNLLFTCIEGDDGHVYTAPVGSFTPNAWGLYDMLGNVWEWCDDWYDAAFYKSSQPEDPHNTKQATDRVIRGGSWNGIPRFARSAIRYGYAPDEWHSNLGFRVARVRSGP